MIKDTSAITDRMCKHEQCCTLQKRQELRSWMLDHSLNKLVRSAGLALLALLGSAVSRPSVWQHAWLREEVEVLDTFETPTCGILRQWSSCNDHWIAKFSTPSVCSKPSQSQSAQP